MNLADLIDKLPSSPIFVIAAIIIPLIPLLRFLKEIFIDFELSRFKKVINTKSYEDGLSTLLKEALVDERDRVAFKKIYNIDADKKYREIILKICEDDNAALDIHDFRLSHPFLYFEDNYIYIKFNIFLYIRKTAIRITSLIIFTLGFLSSIISIKYIQTENPLYFLGYLLSLDDLSAICVSGIFYMFISFSYFKVSRSIEPTIRILKYSDHWSEYIKIKEDWIGKYVLRKIGINPRLYIEANY